MVETFGAISTSSTMLVIASTRTVTHVTRVNSSADRSMNKNEVIPRPLFSHLSWLSLAMPLDLSPAMLLDLPSYLVLAPPPHKQ